MVCLTQKYIDIAKVKKGFLLLLLFSFSTNISLASEFNLDLWRDDIHQLQERIEGRWDDLRAQQLDRQWIDSFVDVSLPGPVYQKGWTNPRVQRNILKKHIDFSSGPNLQAQFGPQSWWVLDEVHIGPSIIESLATIGSNILFHYHVFPFAQAGPLKEKNFVHGRTVENYEDGLLLPPSNLVKIPLETKDLERMRPGEFYTTEISRGLFVRAGGGILNMLGVELPLHLNLGPRTRLQVKTNLQVTLAKESDSHLIIALESVRSQEHGFSLGFGIFFEELIDAPVVIGIDSPEGYSPIRGVSKVESRKLKTVAYRIDLRDQNALSAYHEFLAGDMTGLEDIVSDERDNSIGEVFYKEGQEQIETNNFALNFLIWRSAWQNRTRKGIYTTQFNDEESFRYHEFEMARERSRRFFSNREAEQRIFLAQIPELADSYYILDSEIVLSLGDAKGSELLDLTESLMDWGHLFSLPLEVGLEQTYGDIQLGVNVHMTGAAIKEFVHSDHFDLLVSVAMAYRFRDPFVVISQYERQKFINAGSSDEQRDERRRLINNVIRVYRELVNIRENSSNVAAAKGLVESLNHRSRGEIVHRALLHLIDERKILIRGHLSGTDLR